jgi:hypothetical protein
MSTDRRALVAEYIRLGADSHQIAECMDIPRVAVLREIALMRESEDNMRRLSEAEHRIEVERQRRVTQERYEDLMMQQWDDAVAGSRGAVNTVLQILRDQRSLLGLDRPAARAQQQVQLSGSVGVVALDQMSSAALQKAEQIVAKILEASSAEEIPDSEVIGLLEG